MSIVCLPGVVEKDDGTLTMEEWVQIGRAAGKGRKAVAVACSVDFDGTASLLAVSAGVLSAGAQLRRLGNCLWGEFRCCALQAGAEISLFLENPNRANILEQNGSNATFPLEGAEQQIFGREIRMENLKELYSVFLLRAAQCSLEGEAVTIVSPSQEARKLAETVFEQLGCKNERGGILLRLEQNGGVFTISQKGVFMRGSELLQAVRCCPHGQESLENDELLRLDNFAQAIFLLSHLHKQKKTLGEWKRENRKSLTAQRSHNTPTKKSN